MEDVEDVLVGRTAWVTQRERTNLCEYLCLQASSLCCCSGLDPTTRSRGHPESGGGVSSVRGERTTGSSAGELTGECSCNIEFSSRPREFSRPESSSGRSLHPPSCLELLNDAGQSRVNEVLIVFGFRDLVSAIFGSNEARQSKTI